MFFISNFCFKIKYITFAGIKNLSYFNVLLNSDLLFSNIEIYLHDRFNKSDLR